MPFKKGQSGNPGGRIGVPKEVRELARTHTGDAINRLVFWMQSDDPRASVAASNSLLDRGYGKPVAPIELDHHIGGIGVRFGCPALKIGLPNFACAACQSAIRSTSDLLIGSGT